MAYSIAKAVVGSVKGYNRPGGKASAAHKVSTRKGAGNQGSLRLKRNATKGGGAGSINSGGNYGPLGY